MRAGAARRSSFYDRGSNQRRHKPDYMLVLASALLLALGLITVYAISPGLAAQRNLSENYYITKQLVAICIGLGAFLITAHVPLMRLRSFKLPLIIAAVLATIIALLLPVTPEYPAHRWIRIGGLSLQSVELIKTALLLWLALFLTKQHAGRKLDNYSATLKPLIVLMILIGFVVAVLQSDLGSAAVLVAIILLMGFVAGLSLKRLTYIGGLLLICFGLLIVPFGYRRDRVATFLNPTRDCQGVGYQSCQALIAVGSGGMFGRGLAHSGQAYGYVPEAANDSIFAIFAEKFGFLGSTILISVFVFFFVRLKNILERAPDMFSRLLIAGILAWLSTQSIINIGAMVGLLPLKGITLPFISYGGTSIIFVLAVIGLAFNISRYTTLSANNALDLDDTTQTNHVPRYGAYVARRRS